MTMASHTCAPKAIPFTVVNPSSGEPIHICINPGEAPPPYSAAVDPSSSENSRVHAQHRPSSSPRRAHQNRSYWHPIISKKYWKSVLWLSVLNFPFALIAWVYTFVGTIVGTALLITMPLGVISWWITLVGVRAFAKLELSAQMKYNEPSHHHHMLPSCASSPSSAASPVSGRQAETVIVDESTHLLRSSTSSSAPVVRHQQQNLDLEAPFNEEYDEDDESSIMTAQGEHRVTFLRRTWYLFTDPYSYNALFYFLIPKACIALPLFIISIVLLALGIATIVGLPLALRIIRKLAVWQRNVCREALR